MKGGVREREVDRQLDEVLLEQVNFLQQILRDNANGEIVIKGKTANELEFCIMGLMPIVRVSDTRFLIGSSIKTVQIRSNKLLVQGGGGHVPLHEHWRAIAVSETIKLNKLIN